MDNYHFYKSLYDRELSRRKDLDASINLPVLLLTALVGLNWFIIKEIDFEWNELFTILNVSIILTLISFLTSILFLMWYFNNFFKGFRYNNFGLSGEIRKYETELSEHNDKLKKLDKNML